MFVARFMKVWLSRRVCANVQAREGVRCEKREARHASRYLSLLREAVNLLDTCASDTTFEDAVVLLCVYIERFVVDRGLGLGSMGRG
jgi:hypothetical protein